MLRRTAYQEETKMRLSIKRGLRACLPAVLALATGNASAQSDYPNKPIRLLLPIAAGSVTDVVLRAASQPLSQRLGQQVVIDNRTGASGIVGAEACAKAAPDGYTVCAVYHSIMSYNPYTFDKLPYDAGRDFAPVTNLFFVTEGLVVPSSLPVQSVAELRAFAAKNPAALNLGTLGEGSLQELFVSWLNREWKSSIVGIAYKGGGPIANALGAGEIQIGQMGIGNFLGLIQAGKLRALAISAGQRSKLLPQVPTMAEAGLGGFPARTWWGLVVPTGTPAPVIAKLNAEFVQVFRDPRFAEYMEGRYVEGAAGTPQEFAAFLKSDREAAQMLVRLATPAKR
jgi:tripartite-type tricarboxylate transporter receptor subunit TctC